MKLLFITWDGPQVQYMEGLFFPIFKEIKKNVPVEFHILQFTWKDEPQLTQTREKASELGFKYKAERVYRQPHPLLGSLITLMKGRFKIRKYISDHDIDVIMPRSTMPAIMVNSLMAGMGNKKVIFDADGLPIEERVDFRGLKKGGLQYRVLKKQESKMIQAADRVLTRSEQAVEIHTKNTGTAKNKFFVVKNGRDADHFKSDSAKRKRKRDELNIAENELLFVYCGSLGPQYGLDEMFRIFKKVHEEHGNAKFLVLTGSPDYLEGKLPPDFKDRIMVASVPFEKVPEYLNTADFAFAIRKPTFSMKGIAPIKLGEYLLMGLPTIASQGIGDTEEILKGASGCFLFDHRDPDATSNAAGWVLKEKQIDREEIRSFGIEYFSLKESAESYIRAFEDL